MTAIYSSPRAVSLRGGGHWEAAGPTARHMSVERRGVACGGRLMTARNSEGRPSTVADCGGLWRTAREAGVMLHATGMIGLEVYGFSLASTGGLGATIIAPYSPAGPHLL